MVHPQPEITVCLCTRNRAAMLKRALISLVACDKPTDLLWETLVVNNGSSDETPSVVAGFQDCLPIRMVTENSPGLSNARNRALVAARGSWLLWLDDDVTVNPRWLAAYADHISQHPDTVLLGGAITVALSGNSPKWILQGLHAIGNAYAERKVVGNSQIEARGDVPFGANFGIRKSALNGYCFDPRLGRHPDRPTKGGEETALMRALLNASNKGWWVANAGVTHHIDASRQTEAYLRSYYADQGAMTVSCDSTPRLMVRLLLALVSTCVNEAQYMSQRLAHLNDRRALILRRAATSRGRARGCSRILSARLRRQPG